MLSSYCAFVVLVVLGRGFGNLVHNVVGNVGVVPNFIKFKTCSLVNGDVNMVICVGGLVTLVVVIVVVVVLVVAVFGWAYFDCT